MTDRLSAAEIAEINDRTDLVALIGGKVKLKPKGQEQVGLCPFHSEKTPSFYVIPDKGFFHCFGCGIHGDAVDFVRRSEGVGFMAAIERLRNGEPLTTYSPSSPPRARPERDIETDRKRAAAIAIWRASQPATGTLAERYLQMRSITSTPPPSLRFNPSLRHGPSGLDFPGMVAAVTDDKGVTIAIQRIFLRADGTGKAHVDQPKMSLGPLGSGAVQLAPVAPTLALAEGIEDALSVAQLFRQPAWASLGTRFDRIALPGIVRHVIIYADAGTPGLVAAHRAVEAFTKQRRKVTLEPPPKGFGDWNDVLSGRRAA